MRFQVLDRARDDLIEGWRFYEGKEKGLGGYFLANLYSDIESLKVTGGIHRKVYRGFHRALSKKFPFAVYYTVEADVVQIRAVVDCRRRPSWIRGHIKGAQAARLRSYLEDEQNDELSDANNRPADHDNSPPTPNGPTATTTTSATARNSTCPSVARLTGDVGSS